MIAVGFTLVIKEQIGSVRRYIYEKEDVVMECRIRASADYWECKAPYGKGCHDKLESFLNKLK